VPSYETSEFWGSTISLVNERPQAVQLVVQTPLHSKPRSP